MYWGYNLLFSKLPSVTNSSKTYSFKSFKTTIEANFLKHSSDIYKGEVLQNDWFPSLEADVFISHSHLDKDKAEELAIWLEESFGLRSFIDSHAWGYKDKLTRKIIEKCHTDELTINDVIKISDNITNVLQGAIVSMMMQTDCFIFINSENSINVSSLTPEKSYTYSPWLYFELLLSKTIAKNRKKYRNVYFEDTNVLNYVTVEKILPKVEHVAYLDSLKKIDINTLKTWSIKYRNNNDIDPLDVLDKIAS